MMHKTWHGIFSSVDPNTGVGTVLYDLADPNKTLGAIFYGVLTLLMAWLISRAARVGIHRYLDRVERAGVDPTGIRFLAKLASAGIYLAAFGCYAHVIPALTTLGKSMLAGVGVASVVVGLAAQSTLGNLIAGISLILYRPFKIGDRIQVNAPGGLETGTVVNIDLGYTVLRTVDQRMIVIPNSVIASQASINLSAVPPAAPFAVSLYLATGGNVARARQLFSDLAKAHPKISQVDGCHVTRVTSKGILLTLNAITADPNAVAAIKSDLLEGAQKQFDAAGLKVV